MDYRNLGRSGLQVSVVGLGCNNFGMRMDMDATQAVVDKAIDLGVTLFDTADVYGGSGKSEEFLGKALGGRRHDVVLATKFGMKMGEGPFKSGASRKYIVAECEASLTRLGTDYIDLYQIHTPDPSTPIEETMQALDDLVRAGKVRYTGHSNFTGWMTAEAHYIAQMKGITPFVSAQNEYSLLFRGIEAELVPAMEKFGVSLLPYFPLASGMLTGKYRRGQEAPAGTRFGEWFKGPYGQRTLNDRNYDIVEKLEAFAKERGHTLLETAMGWLVTKPYVGSVIAGATRIDQLEQNAAAGLAWRLSAEEMAEVNKIAS